MHRLILVLIILISALPTFAQGQGFGQSLNDPMVDAQERLLHAKGNYVTLKQQEKALKDMKKATKLSLRAATLRAKAERLQNKADVLVNKANQSALSRGLYIRRPHPGAEGGQPPPPPAGVSARTATAPPSVPVPGRPINIIVPPQEEVSYQDESYLPNAPTNNY